MSNTLRCSLLLQLPDQATEARFWADEYTLRAYTGWDFYITLNMIAGNLMFTRTMWGALINRSALPHTWHIHVNVLTNLVVCTVMIVLIRRYGSTYHKHRHTIVTFNRLMRLGFMALAITRSSNALQAVIAQAMNAKPAAASTITTLRTAVLNLSRPLFIAPIITMAHGSWVIEVKYWLPLQLVTTLMAIFGSMRHQHCRLAAEPASARLLQSTCHSVSGLHSYMLGAVFGLAPGASLPAPGASGLISSSSSSSQHEAACSTMTSAARTLVWYSQLVYGLLMPSAGFVTLEWRLKCRWVQKELVKQLVYGPLRWPRARLELRSWASMLQSVVSWLLFIVGGLAAAWQVSVWLVPVLPLMACETCEDKGDCQAIELCGGILCDDPGYTVAVFLYLQILITLLGHLAVTRVM